MRACPSCGESVRLEARLCRHCSRSLLHRLELTRSLKDRETLQFLKLWQSVKSEHGKIRAFTYQEAKALFRKPPLVLADELTAAEAESLQSAFLSFGVEAKFGTETQVREPLEPPHPVHRMLSFFYGAVALLLLTVAGLLIFRKEPPQQVTQPSNRFATPSPPSLETASPSSSQNQISNSREMPNEPSGEITREAVNILLNAAVFIRGAQSLGSGFFITNSGHIITNHHVVAEMSEPTVILRNGRQFRAEKVSFDPRLDLALLKISHSGHEFLRLGDANELYPGEPILTIGNPGGLSFTVTRGVVSYVGRLINGVPFIQTDAAINRGNSGGPMINQKGEVVAVNTLTSLREQGISFSVPINFICSPGGMAAHLPTTPGSCARFDTTGQPVAVEQMIAGESAPSPQGLGLEHYQNEAKSIKAEADRLMGRVKDSEFKLMKDLQEKKAKLNGTTNMEEIFRLEAEIKQHQKEMLELQQDSFRVQIRYLDQIISLLERQRGDPGFRAVADQITAEIERVRSERESIASKIR